MSRDTRSRSLQLTLCLGLFLLCDGFIHGSQMSKVKVQLTDTISSSLIRRNILHSETISNRPSSSLQAKQPLEPASQEQSNEEEVPVVKQRVKNQNVIQKGAPRKAFERNVKNVFKTEANDERDQLDPETALHGDQFTKPSNTHSIRSELPQDINNFLDRLQQALDDGKLKFFVKILKSLAMEGGNNDCLAQLVPLVEKLPLAELDSAMTADLIWSLGKLNLVVQNSDHKNLLMSLLNRFCEHEEMTPREVTTSLVR